MTLHQLERNADAPGVGAAMRRLISRLLLVVALLGIAVSSSGCLWVRDDDGHHHWRWHHRDMDHDDYDHEHHDDPR
jgi:hypothetical protein